MQNHLLANESARKLAKRFCKMYAGDLVRDSPTQVGRVDEDLMTSWFAQAMELQVETDSSQAT